MVVRLVREGEWATGKWTNASDAPRPRFPDIASPIVDEAIKQAKEIAGDPSAEGLHQLRISMRRLRSLWWSYRPLLDMGKIPGSATSSGRSPTQPARHAIMTF
ncbi:CHAD domain-containing protein [Paraburkholderia sp. A1RO-1]|uniref:CHAD domain-containing protein n=1 Tax=Paraburkholderia sp. A1RO-1 TaxID=3028368 RepID=UPI003B7C4A55